MKKKRILFNVLIATLLLLGTFGCASGNNQSALTAPPPQSQRNPGINPDVPGGNVTTIPSNSNMFREGGTGTLTITNQASFDIIIFAGNIDPRNILGGIRAGRERTFDLRNSINLRGNGSFMIRAASFETYGQVNRITEEHILYSALVVYDLDQPTDKTHLNIYAGIDKDRDEWIYVSNSSRFVLELRLDTPNGEKLATLAPWHEGKQLFLTPLPNGMPYSFYPTYVYVDPKTNEIRNFGAKGEDRRWEIPDTRVTPIVFSGPESSSDIMYRLGFIRVKNDTNENFQFKDGGTILPDQKTRRMVATGQLSTFELPADSPERGRRYANLNIEFQNRRTLQVDPTEIKPGWVYEVTISGSPGNYRASPFRPIEYRDKLEEMEMQFTFK